MFDELSVPQIVAVEALAFPVLRVSFGNGVTRDCDVSFLERFATKDEWKSLCDQSFFCKAHMHYNDIAWTEEFRHQLSASEVYYTQEQWQNIKDALHMEVLCRSYSTYIFLERYDGSFEDFVNGPWNDINAAKKFIAKQDIYAWSNSHVSQYPDNELKSFVEECHMRTGWINEYSQERGY